ncbi:MAG: TOBE-like domain-containing protein [Leptospirales bacterium]|nr:TOBE-like domain-containing protein [Leptospirales bacterium]
MEIEIKGLTKQFGDFAALRGVDLRAPSGALTALLGPSGCGKTTLLRIVAGLETADGGEVLFGGQPAAAQLKQRRVGFVFQHYALFRHMSVFENVAFGLRVKPRQQRLSRPAIREKVLELLHLVQLSGYQDRLPAQLSGGQRQRVALARALAVEPQVLLLDEPFGALDAGVRRELRRWLRKLHDEVKITSLFVTHDQDEALEVADQVAIMRAGKLEQAGAPEAVYARPATPFVFEFLGAVNLFHGRMENGALNVSDVHSEEADRAALVYVRPHELALSRQRAADSLFSATVESIRSAGPAVRVLLRSERGQNLEAELSAEQGRALALLRGESVFVALRNKQVYFEDFVI